jgi:uncharacterized RDD family membrane protein YckC
MNEEHSPYAPPESNVEEVINERTEVELAGKWLRFANYFVDNFLASFISVSVFLILARVFGDQVAFLGGRWSGYAYDFGFYVAFYILFEINFGRTPAKWITGTLVIDEHGNKPGTGQLIGRSFSRIVPFEPLSFLGARGRGWHDSWSNTYVVKARGYQYGRIKLSDDPYKEKLVEQPKLSDLLNTGPLEVEPGMKVASIVSEESIGAVKYSASMKTESDLIFVRIIAEFDNKRKQVVNDYFHSEAEAAHYLANNTKFRIGDFKEVE